MSNVALAFLEPTISLWVEDNLTSENWKVGIIWLPAFFPHVFGVILTVKMARKYPHYQWIMAAAGLALEGLCCFIIPFANSYIFLMIPICGICFGIALIDTALLPTLGYLVDTRYVSVYGSIYAIADISYSVAYAVGPIIAGGVVEAIGFTALNVGIAFSNLLYAPMLMYLKHIYDFKPLESEANILMADPPIRSTRHTPCRNRNPYRRIYRTTWNIDSRRQTSDSEYQDLSYNQPSYEQQNYSQNYQQGAYQQPNQQYSDPSYQQQQPPQPPQRPSTGRVLPQQPEAANPFRPQTFATGGNPFRQGL
ncbi:hypothetical protein NQ317_008488 [Molorchus minor]|uniref:Vesicular acetylcholine transporter n=1 Tax=Molorchus minor TaxID=1323400 RepID=A0ABQ9JLB1_9CUCU|nr:hypothetical protein NQ317_008488 [Molorchus minor]